MKDTYTHICTNFSLAIRNYNDYSYNFALTSFNFYDEKNNFCGWKKFILKKKLYTNNNNSKSLIENNKLFIDVYLRVYDYKRGTYSLNYSIKISIK